MISEESLSDDVGNGRRLAHNLAQFVHCVAQGKVGSGFDVSAAVFGSHLYTRFDPSVIQDLMGDNLVCDFLSVLTYDVTDRGDFFCSRNYTLFYLLQTRRGTIASDNSNYLHIPG